MGCYPTATNMVEVFAPECCPDKAMKTVFRLLLRALFRFRAYDAAVLKTPGPVLLIPNHTSWIDWLFLWVCLEEDWRMVTSSLSAQTSWLHRKLMIKRYTLPVDPGSPYAVVNGG